MKTNSLALDPDLTSQLGDCAVGDEKQITVTLTVTGHDATGLTGDVTAVEQYDATEASADATEGEPAGAATPGSGSKALKAALGA